jgi:hypothetical protein
MVKSFITLAPGGRNWQLISPSSGMAKVEELINHQIRGFNYFDKVAVILVELSDENYVSMF